MRKFEYLDPDIVLSMDDFYVVRDFLEIAGFTQIGWHYIVDLTWIYSKVKNLPIGSKVLDAGGGGGPVQYLLAEMGYHVTNIDLLLHEKDYLTKKRYSLQSRILYSYSPTDYLEHLGQYKLKKVIRHILSFIKNNFLISRIVKRKYFKNLDVWRIKYKFDHKIGTILMLKGNLCSIPEIMPNSFDAVVSLSAVEHIPIKHISRAISEIERVVKNNGIWAVTTSASTSSTWFHEPSKGYAYSKDDLCKIFSADADADGDGDPCIVLQQYKRSDYLRRNLANFYYKSCNNGMPNGVWDPKYIPVGIY